MRSDKGKPLNKACREKVRRAVRKVTASAMTAVMALSAFLGAIAPAAAYASTGATAELVVGSDIPYDGNKTNWFWGETGGQRQIGYCIDPKYPNQPGGTFPTSGLNAVSGRNEEARTQLWFSYGAPGFDASMWPSTWYDGSAMDAEKYIILSHILLSDTMSSDFTYATVGCSQAFKDYASYNILGMGHSGHPWNADSTLHQIAARAGEVPSQSVFDAYQMNCGDGWQTVVSFTYNPQGGISLSKSSANPSITDGNGCYSLGGAVYGIYADQGCTQLVAQLNTDPHGRSDYWGLDGGRTYYVKEITPPEGYYLDTTVHPVAVSSAAWSNLNVSDAPKTDPIGMLVGKYDGEKAYKGEGNLPQGSASLEGAQFTVKYYDTLAYDSYDALNAANVKPARTWVVRTDPDGFCDLSRDCFVSGDEFYTTDAGKVTIPRGTVVIYESKAPEGYLLNDSVSFQKLQEGQHLHPVTTFNTPQVPESVIRGGVEVPKRDFESGLPTPLGGASLDGTQFEIKNLSVNPVIVNGISYGKGQVVATLTVRDGEAVSASDLLPYGDYSIQEVRAGEGYLLTDGTVYEFSIRDEGTMVNPITGGVVKNEVKRGDFEFNKKTHDTADRLAYVPFKVTSDTTGEAHVVVTDANGYFSSASSWNEHTANTNGNDWALSATGTIDSSKLDAEAGVWFGLASNGSMVKADNSRGAMPYDTYSVEELPCTANKGYELVSTSIAITRNGVVVDFGTIDDVPIGSSVTLTTRAYDPVDNDNRIGVGDVLVADKVTYTGLTLDKSYKLKATLHDSETGDAILVDGNAVTATKTFTATSSAGFQLIEFEVPTYDLAGKRVTVYEELFALDGGTEKPIAQHTDKDDVDQQLIVVAPEIGTTAADGVDGDKLVSPDDAVSVTDTVAYANLIPGKEYTVKGSLHVKKTDKEGNVTEEALEVDGKPVTAETTFTPEKSEGTVDVTFTFDGLSIKDGTQLVAFESLEHKGRELAVHADIEDESQTVTVQYPEIGTTAADGVDGDKNVVIDGQTTVVDTVSYTNLIPGKEYTVKGSLHVKKTDKEGNVTEEALEVDGKPVTAETTFTPEKSEGTVDVTFTFDSSSIKDKTEIVVFESLERAGVEIATHADIEDEAQTVTARTTSIGTTATDGLDGDKTVIADAETTITDDVAYENALPGTAYTMAGILMDAGTGLPILTGEGSDKFAEKDLSAFMEKLSEALGISASDKDGADAPLPAIDAEALGKLMSDDEDIVSHLVYQTAVFTPEKSDGTVSMDFSFDANDVIDRLSGEVKPIVVFEAMFKGDLADAQDASPILVAAECDPDNEAQTVTLAPSAIGTTATDKSDGDHELMPGKDSVITDHVVFAGLIPGKEYTLKATLMDKATGKPLSVGDRRVTAELKFTPNSQSGSVDIDLGPFDSSELDGHDLVVFEELYKQSHDGEGATDILVAEHKDLEDEGQTVTVTSTPPGGFFSKTGGSNAHIWLAVGLLVAVGAAGAAYVARHRPRTDKAADASDTDAEDGRATESESGGDSES